MNFTVNTRILQTTLVAVARAIGTPQIPILTNLKISSFYLDKLTITVFDSSQGTEITINAEIKEPGSLLLPTKLLTDLISKLSSVDLSFRSIKDADSVQISSDKSTYKLPSKSADDYPDLPAPDQDPITPIPKALKKTKQPVIAAQYAEIPVDAIKHALKTILLSVSTDVTRGVLTGVYLKISNETKSMVLAATDGHRLTEAKHDFLDTDELQDIEMIIPALALKEADRLFSLFKPDNNKVSIQADQQVIQFTWQTAAGKQRFISRSLQGVYPNYLSLIPKSFGRSATIVLSDFINSLNRIAVLAERSNNIVEVSMIAGSVRVFADVADVGTGSEEVPALTIGDNTDTAFNVKYLLEGLRTISEQNILMEMNGPIEQVVFTPIGNVNLKYLVMPVQIRS
jgi:DNA polymerase III subunit beta